MGGPGRKSVLAAILMTLAAPVLAYAAVRNAALDAAVDTGADPSATLPPRSVAPSLTTIMRGARNGEVPLPLNAVDVARRAAIRMPLAFEPYFITARAAEQAGDYDRATTLMEEARRRRPSSPSVRVALLGYYSLANAYQAAIDEADMAMRVDTESQTLILPAFAKLVAADPKARSAIAAALAKRPPWRDNFLNAAVEANMSPADASSLVADVRSRSPSSAPQTEEAFLVRLLVRAGDYRGARALFERYRANGSALPQIIDGRFSSATGVAPFNWLVYSNEEGAAEIAKVAGGGETSLDVDVFGDAPVRLAEQTLAAPPGAYVLSSNVRGTSSSADIGLSWTLVCLPSNRQIAALPLQPLTSAPTRKRVSVMVPSSGCDGQGLGLVGQPGEIARSLSAQVLDVSFERTGSR